MYVYCYLLSLKNYPKIVVPGVPDCVTSGSETFSALFLGPCNTQNMVKMINERAQMILQKIIHFQQYVSKMTDWQSLLFILNYLTKCCTSAYMW